MSSTGSNRSSEEYGYVRNLRDDIIYIIQAREVMLQHPSRHFAPQLLNAAFCRLYLIVMVAYIEHILEKWQEEGGDQHGIIEAYLKEVARKGSTADSRLQILKAGFDKAGINVDPDVLDDFSAIVRLRNAIVHSDLKPAHRTFIEKQGFPSDPAQFNGDHFAKIHRILQELLDYLERAGGIGSSEERRLFGFTSPMTQPFPSPDDRLNLFRLRDVPGMLWHNLERIRVHIQQDIQSIKRSDELHILECLAARKASQNGVASLAQHRPLGVVALESWREYWKQAFGSRGITASTMQEAAASLLAAFEANDYPNLPFVEALNLANAAAEQTKNTAAIGLLAVELPIIDPERTGEYLDEAEKALCAFRLWLYHDALKNWFEESNQVQRQRDMREAEERVAFYRQIIDAYRADSLH